MVGKERLSTTIDMCGANNPEQRAQLVMHLLILVLMSLLMAVHLHYRSPDFPFTADSAVYFEQARNLVNVGSALNTPYGLTPADKDQVESGIFPIGFPIVIAVVSSLGFDAKVAVTGIGHLSAILLPWLLYFCLRNALGSVCALVIAGLSLMSPGILVNSPMGLTDVLSLAIVVGAIGLILNSVSAWSFIFGGMLAGMAYAVRNAHLALLITIALYFCCVWLISTPERRRLVYKQAANFVGGVSIIVLPLLTRNLLLFGSLNPYQMPPSTIGFIENSRTYIQALLKDITACGDCATYIAWSIPGLLLFAIATLCLIWLFVKYEWVNLEDVRKRAILFSIIYIIVGSCIVIAARTRYQWGEVINLRHTLQYTPFVFSILMAIVFGQSQRLSKIRWFLVAFLVLFHANFALSFDSTKKKSSYPMLLSAYQTGESHLCASEKDVFLVSNWAEVFRIQCNARVRYISYIAPARNKEALTLIGDNEGYASLMDAIADIKNKAMGRPIHAGFFPGKSGLEFSNFPLSDTDQQVLLDSSWTIIRNDKRGLLIQHGRMGRAKRNPSKNW